jgi:hydrogenase nickel incorporation protein HypA/HybF
MHELSITMSILEIVEENAKKLNAESVHEIEMDIGELSGIDYDALEFAMEHAQKSDMLKDAKLVINKIPAKAKCNSCQHEFEINDYYSPCPVCNTFDNEVIQGKELKVKTFKID